MTNPEQNSKILTPQTVLERGAILLDTYNNETYIVAMVGSEDFCLVSLQNGNRFAHICKTSLKHTCEITANDLFIATSTSCNRFSKLFTNPKDYFSYCRKNRGCQKL